MKMSKLLTIFVAISRSQISWRDRRVCQTEKVLTLDGKITDSFKTIERNLLKCIKEEDSAVINQRAKINSGYWLLSPLREYGCFCPALFDDSVSIPKKVNFNNMDDVDILCYNLYRNYNCIKKDFEICDINSHQHKIKLNFGTDDLSQTFVCESSGVDCQDSTCLLEASFISKILQYSFDHGEFIKPKECAKSGSSVSDKVDSTEIFKEAVVRAQVPQISVTQCCGNYPNRVPFTEGKNMCCDGMVMAMGACV